MSRQYEKSDCIEDVVPEGKYKIGMSIVTANPVGECDEVVVFGNPKTKNVVWIPYGSHILIKNQEYEVIRGALNADFGRRFCPDLKDQSADCLRSLDGKLHSMEEFMDQSVEIKQLNTKKPNLLFSWLYEHRKRNIKEIFPWIKI